METIEKLLEAAPYILIMLGTAVFLSGGLLMRLHYRDRVRVARELGTIQEKEAGQETFLRASRRMWLNRASAVEERSPKERWASWLGLIGILLVLAGLVVGVYQARHRRYSVDTAVQVNQPINETR